jgi:hypothetical protein
MTRRLRILAAITIFATVALVAAGPAASRRPSALAADPPPANDNFRNSISTNVGAQSPRATFVATTENATLEAGEPRPCGNIGATVWYQFSLSSRSKIAIDTAGSDFDTVLAVYDAPADLYPSPPGTLTPAQCNDNYIGLQSRLDVVVEAWTPYWLQVGGASGATGSLMLNIACDPACAPENDDIAQATYPGLPNREIVHTDAATTEPGEPSPCGQIGRTVWYVVWAPATSTIAVDATGSDYQTVVAAYTGTEDPAGFLPVRNVACSPKRIEFAVTAGTAYLVQVGGRDGAAGELHVTFDCAPTPCPPPGDSKADAQLLGGDTILEVDTSGATVEPGEPLNCGIVGATVWYHVQAAPTLRIRLSAADSDYPVAMAAYRWATLSPPGGVTFAQCGDPTQPSTMELGPDPVFLEYLVQIGSTRGRGGSLRLRAECISGGPCANGDQPAFEPTIISTEPITGGPGYRSAPIAGPDTGSGGYLPGAR